MKTWANRLVLILGIAFLLASLIVYAAQYYGGGYYSVFLVLFLLGLLVLGSYGTIGIRRPEPVHSLLTKIILVFMFFANTIIAASYMNQAPATASPGSLRFWLILLAAGLAVANFFFCLAIWNERRWGMWAFALSTFLSFVLNLVIGAPLIPTFFGLSSAVVLYLLIRPAWTYMD